MKAFRFIPVAAGLAMGMAMAAETPVCAEFEGEQNITCVQNDSVAVISSISATGRSIEFYKGHRKGYIEISEDGSIYASSGTRYIGIPAIPAEDKEGYIGELMESILDDIVWTDGK